MAVPAAPVPAAPLHLIRSIDNGVAEMRCPMRALWYWRRVTDTAAYIPFDVWPRREIQLFEQLRRYRDATSCSDPLQGDFGIMASVEIHAIHIVSTFPILTAEVPTQWFPCVSYSRASIVQHHIPENILKEKER